MNNFIVYAADKSRILLNSCCNVCVCCASGVCIAGFVVWKTRSGVKVRAE